MFLELQLLHDSAEVALLYPVPRVKLPKLTSLPWHTTLRGNKLRDRFILSFYLFCCFILFCYLFQFLSVIGCSAVVKNVK
jgi:hypothetical protein